MTDSGKPIPQEPWPAPLAARPLNAIVSLPGSKSLTNRALVLAALADGPSVVRRALRSRDTLLMASALTALGAPVDTTGADWLVAPGECADDVSIDCGLAGTVMRFVPPMAALSRGTIRFDGDPHMRSRPIGPMLAALSDLGVRISAEATSLPFEILGNGSARGGRVEIDASTSSQFISALLLTGARFDQGVDVHHVGPPVPSMPHIKMTIQMLREHAVLVDSSEEHRWTVEPSTIKAVDEAIEPDLSNAAPFLALALVSGGSVTIRDWPQSTNQPGDALRDILTEMGAQVSHTQWGLEVRGTGVIHGVELDLHELGELTPAIAALCALADSPSTLRGVAHIRGHETDRLNALATELAGLGADVTEHADGLSVRPARLTGGLWHTYADHRMAHAGVILGAAVPGVLVENIETTAKTFPNFADTWADLW